VSRPPCSGDRTVSAGSSAPCCGTNRSRARTAEARRIPCDETKLIEKLRRIEALHAGATTDGERVAAADERILRNAEP
jgi:hypothetical protein